MKRTLHYLKGVALLLAGLNYANAQTPDSCTFVEHPTKPILTVDFESTNLNNGYWVKQNDVPGALGDGYIQYLGGDATGTPGRSELSYTIKVSGVGPYSFKIRAYREDYHDNDVWVRFPEAQMIVGKELQFIDTIEAGVWKKAMIGPEDRWYHTAKTQLPGTAYGEQLFDMYILFPGAGTYTVQFSGRATGFRLDRFGLYDLNRGISGFQGMADTNKVYKTSCVPYSNANNPYVAQAIPDQTVTGGTAWTYTIPQGAFVNPDGNNLNYVARTGNMQPLPAGMTFTAATRTFNWTPQYADGGKYNILVTARDNTTGKFTVDAFVLTVLGNNPPVIANPIEDTTATVGQTFSFTIPNGTFTDADANQTLTYTVTSHLGNSFRTWLSYDPNTKTFTGNPAKTDVGNDTIYVTVNDGNGGEITESFLITVRDVTIRSIFGSKTKLSANVYPNPVENSVNIKVDESGRGTLTLCDQVGRIYFTEANLDLNKEVSLDLSSMNLQPGLYLVKIQTEEGVEYHGMIVKK